MITSGRVPNSVRIFRAREFPPERTCIVFSESRNQPIDRTAEREAKREELRLARLAEKEKQREARALREAAAREAQLAAEQAVLEAKRLERKERKANEKMDAQSRRAERLAAYQSQAITDSL